MTAGLAIAFVIICISAWVTLMYIWWQMTRGHVLHPLKLEHIEHELERGARLARRGWYASTLYGGRILNWGNKQAISILVRVFPKAKEAFVKHDELAGLAHGPSSYFLMSISEKPKKVARKNVVS